MDRREFLTQVGAGAVISACAACLSGCSDDSDPIAPPANVDFTLDLSDPANSALTNDGGYLYSSGVIVARTSGGGYVAVSQQCTHQGTTIVYRLSTNDFYCNAHGSTFSTAGAVTNGPAASPLGSYKTTLTGNLLRVQS